MHPGPTKSVLIIAYVALLLLLAASAGGAFLPMGAVAKTVLALSVAVAKALIIFLIFMQLRYQNGLIRVFALAGFFWLAISALLTFADYLTRGNG